MMLLVKILSRILALAATMAIETSHQVGNVTCHPGAIQPIREVDCDHAINSTIRKDLIQVDKTIEIFHGSCKVRLQAVNVTKLELDPATVRQAKLKILNTCENYPGFVCITSNISIAITYSEAGLDPAIHIKDKTENY
ncbi:uncharacterized protein MELLADRAFT_93985 [Melampsora larici-populina 98AG31]|uniref:Secreted protein n=1 Tax=Melampsora larici-populina (strain 98AG31 / pathotype 3-4-7) TaxID=747676 RepID=F4S5Z9_MELLP|nr:uncharacterized protein MELLADRAFT_93985 [Melampsora larici-populina 98AG31]EGF99928.1 secreted protein [Melampsora larici-populina 98AG31]